MKRRPDNSARLRTLKRELQRKSISRAPFRWSSRFSVLLRLATGWILSFAVFSCCHLAAQDIAPRKHTLTIPVPIATTNNQTVECTITLGPSAPVAAVAFSPDGKRLATGGYQEVLVWDLAKAALLKRIGGCSGAVHALAFSKDGKLLAAGEGTLRSSGAVRIFDIESGQAAAAFQEAKDEINAVALSPDGKLLAAVAADNSTYLWSMDEKKIVATLGDHSDRVLSVAFSADGKFLATGSTDRTARVREAGTWKVVTKMDQTEAVNGLDLRTLLRRSPAQQPSPRSALSRVNHNATERHGPFCVNTGKNAPRTA